MCRSVQPVDPTMEMNNTSMNRVITVAIVGLITLSVLGLVPTAALGQNVGPNEPNDNRSSATPIEDRKVEGVVNSTSANSSVSDTDWYSIVADKGETITFLLSKKARDETGLRISVFPPDSDQYEYDLTVWEDGDTREQYTFTAPVKGKYYLRLDKNVPGADVAVPYSVQIKNTTGRTNISSAVNNGVQQETEPNDDSYAASPLRESNISGTITQKGESDWYSLNATEGENISFTFAKPANSSIMTMALYAPNRSELANTSAFEGASTASISTTAPTTGTYYIYLGSDYSGQNIPYRLYTPASAAPESPTLGTAQTQSQTGEGTTTPSSTTTDGSTQSETTGHTSITYPPGYSASGIEDPTRAASQYSSALSNYSSYSAQRNFTSIFQGEVNHINNTVRVDVANERAYTYENISGDGNPIVEETYRTEDIIYTRTLSSLSDGPQYEAQSQPFTITYNTTTPALEQYLQSATYGPAEIINRNGETLIRYEATEIIKPSTFLVTGSNTSSVSSFNATLVVDQNGILRNYSYSVAFEGEDGNQVQKQSTLALTNLNETSVSEPAWIDEARANLSGQSESTSVVETTATTTGEPATQTMETTATPTESTNGSILTNTNSDNGSDGSGASGPGFGLAVAVVAVLAAGLLATRQQNK